MSTLPLLGDDWKELGKESTSDLDTNCRWPWKTGGQGRKVSSARQAIAQELCCQRKPAQFVSPNTYGKSQEVFLRGSRQLERNENNIFNVYAEKLFSAEELFEFVSDKVREQTSGRQSPRALAGTNRDFPLTTVGR
ncbi:MAG: hypothetical protein V7638_4412 [Acidobacteriota bacterium]|jgi:hypothetical protein